MPIHCPLCPKFVSGNPQTIWKYNALYYLITEPSNNGIVPEIPGELLVKMFIHKQEETALGIGEDYIHEWRRETFLIVMDDQQKRGRSDIVSTTLSDSHDAKKGQKNSYTRVDIFTIVYYKRNSKFNVIY
jgi:hypothetical protein